MKRKASKPKAIKLIKPTLKKKVYSKEDLEGMSQGELQYLAKQNERRIKRLLKSYEKRGFHVEASLYENPRMKAPKKASIKTIERLQAYTPSKIQTNKKIFLVDAIDGKLVSYKGKKAFAKMKEFQEEKKLQDFYKNLGTNNQTKPPKIAKYKNPLGNKKIPNDESITWEKGKKIPNKVKLKKSVQPNTQEAVQMVDANGTLNALVNSWLELSEVLGYRASSPPFGDIRATIQELINEKGLDYVMDLINNQAQLLSPSYLLILSSQCKMIDCETVGELIEGLAHVGLITQAQEMEAYRAYEEWKQGFRDNSDIRRPVFNSNHIYRTGGKWFG